MNKKLKIAILTSGGDAPGMNAAIRAIVLACNRYNYDCIGVYHGYNGLINADIAKLKIEAVNNIIQQGGTLLKSARCPELRTKTGVQQAINTLIKEQIDALIVIGGDGSFTGLLAIAEQWRGQVIGLPGTIDNDLDGTDYTIGFATAINTAIEAIDKIRDTANAFDRVFIVELMGRNSGHIAFNVGVACAAEQIISFENFHPSQAEDKLAELAEEIYAEQKSKDNSYLVVLAENLWPGGAMHLAEQLKEQFNIDCAACVLGHIQRGGSPVAKDRILATKLGVGAVQAIKVGKSLLMLGERDNEIVEVALSETIKHSKTVNENLVAAQQNILALTARSN
ncbi:ATP-dependent 6-phosphofructokinase [Thalassotalea atypica]|uniref:ATP-dependent 6-phosphofructokinase n=1 Tax=Thalassotalea atypica TaxID=2054316 RepID=UPI002572F0E3|nr:ATP-dependent 6-phosphofructokinase [Thalassotalea atypica]